MYRDAEHGEEDGQLEEHGVDQDAGGLVVEDPDRPLQQRSVTVGVLSWVLTGASTEGYTKVPAY